MNKTNVCLSMVVIFNFNHSSAFAQQDSIVNNNESVILDTIIVTAERNKSLKKDIPSNVSVITDDTIEDQQSKDLQEIFRYTPGVNFDGNGRFNMTDIRIRGVSDNRVQLRVDGIPMPEEYSFGPFQSSGRQYFDVDDLKQVEVLRGPTSSLYGSSAIGGVVTFTTKDPYDFLQGDEKFGGNLRFGYSADDNQFKTGTTLASSLTDNAEALFSYTYRDGSEKKSYGGIGETGSDREQADPQDIDSHNILSKIIYNLNSNNMFTFGISYFNQDTDTNLLSDTNTVSRGAIINSRKAFDETQREAYSLRHDIYLNTFFAENAFWQFYYQDTDTRQKTLDIQTFQDFQDNINRDSKYNNESVGFDFQMDKAFDLLFSNHNIVYGASYKNEDISMLRTSNSLVSRASEEKNFPDSDVDEFGLFLQDTIGFNNSKFKIVPGIRYDYYNLTPKNDDLYLTTSGNIPAVEINENEVSYRIGLLYELNDFNTTYFNYSQGFRAPAFDDANVGFTNFAGGYTTIANPDLKAERSHGFELGLKGDGSLGNYDVNVFYTRYNDFIDNLGSSNFNPATGLLEFQTINLDSAEIWGTEFSTSFDLSRIHKRMNGFRLNSSLAYADGEDRETNEPITSIEPLNATVGISYQAPNNKWKIENSIRMAKGKSSSNINESNKEAGITESGGYALFDLYGHYMLTDKAKINAGVYNLFDKKYIQWGQAQTISAEDRDRFTEPGRFASINFSYDF